MADTITGIIEVGIRVQINRDILKAIKHTRVKSSISKRVITENNYCNSYDIFIESLN